VSTRYVAGLFEAAGTDHIVTIDVHNLQAFQNSFRIPSENLEAKKLFAGCLTAEMLNDDMVIMSPDIGGIKRAEQFQRTINMHFHKETAIAFMEKYRSGGEVWGETVVGDVKGKTAIIIDDLVSTGGTLARSAASCRRAGAKKIIALATHGLFTGKSDMTLQEESLEKIIVTNTIPPFRLENTQVKEKVQLLNVAPLFAEAIKRLDEGGSITGLLED
jgi:ribose-phosphate pyrophosphokinase